MIWRCPKCTNLLIAQDNNLVCSEGHQYDRAKQGYIHLLLANQKNSRDPGDNEAMISARRTFLRAGYYDPLVDSIAEVLSHEELLNFDSIEQKRSVTILDLGCGEGYYLETLLNKVRRSCPQGFLGFGLDISKAAVRKAASSAKQLFRALDESPQKYCLDYAVASNANVPVCDQSVDVILTVFAPIVGSEVKRLLKPYGIFLRVAPGPRHLYQLRSEIYQEVSAHAPPKIEKDLVLEKEISVQFNISLNSSDAIEQLLAMTPFSWHGKGEAKKELIARAHLSIEADFLIQICRSNTNGN